MRKKFVSICVAFLLAFLVVNSVLFVYKRTVSWIDTPNGVCLGLRKPHSTLILGTEGYGITKIDSYGFTNQDFPLADEYILMMGASHTQGKEINSSCRYATIVNNALTDNRELRAFSIACDGNFLPSIIKHFKSAIENYPDSKCITIEISGTDYSVEELKKSVIQTERVDTRSASELFASQSMSDRVKNLIKEDIPLVSMVKSHIETSRRANTAGGYSVNAEEYRAVITECLSLIRCQYDGPIVFVYHPVTEIQNDGSIKIVRSQTLDIFREACENTGIDFIDTGDAFLKYFNEYYELPYGFANTTPGSGHLNEVGHKIMADTIIDYLEEVGCK